VGVAGVAAGTGGRIGTMAVERADADGANEIRVVACVARRGDRYLVCQRPADKRHGGLWEFPGGKVEPGEDDATAARRELAEELGVGAALFGAERFRFRDPGSPFMIVFLEAELRGDPVPHEHAALCWSTVAELSRMPLAPADAAFAAALAAGGGLESLLEPRGR
jgi:8-oxo-dGTP diphosphatase